MAAKVPLPNACDAELKLAVVIFRLAFGVIGLRIGYNEQQASELMGLR